jgi:hypothetical protein
LISATLAGVLLAAVPDGRAAGKLTVSEKDCAAIARHAPAADVAFKPGIDTWGRQVAPADLGGGSPIKPPREITIEIGIDMEEKYGLGAGGDYTATANVGKVNVKDGQVTFNGQPLGNRQQRAVSRACRDTYEK